MIKFFRNIRQNLIMENKTSKYLKYAIGEIVLVVIGILIALQINNWNEVRKSDSQVQLLLNNLVEAINQDIDYLQSSAILHEFRSNSLRYLVKMSDNDFEFNSRLDPIPKYENSPFWDGAYPDTLNLNLMNRTYYFSGINDNTVINKNVLDELKSTGLFSAIKNDSLKIAINTYYSFVDRHFITEDWNENLTVSWREFLRDNYGVLTMQLYAIGDPLSFVKQNKPVQTRMYEMIGPARFRSSNASKAISLAQDVIKEINGELITTTK